VTFFVTGPDSMVRVDQIAAAAECDEGIAVVLLSGEKVLIRKTLDDFSRTLEVALYEIGE